MRKQPTEAQKKILPSTHHILSLLQQLHFPVTSDLSTNPIKNRLRIPGFTLFIISAGFFTMMSVECGRAMPLRRVFNSDDLLATLSLAPSHVALGTSLLLIFASALTGQKRDGVWYLPLFDSCVFVRVGIHKSMLGNAHSSLLVVSSSELSAKSSSMSSLLLSEELELSCTCRRFVGLDLFFTVKISTDKF